MKVTFQGCGGGFFLIKRFFTFKINNIQIWLILVSSLLKKIEFMLFAVGCGMYSAVQPVKLIDCICLYREDGGGRYILMNSHGKCPPFTALIGLSNGQPTHRIALEALQGGANWICA